MPEYIAQTTLKVMSADGAWHIYQAGDRIPDFSNWNIHAVNAHLELEMVRRVDTPQPPAADVVPPANVADDGDATDDTQGLIPVACEVCGKTFAGQSALKKHKKKHHA